MLKMLGKILVVFVILLVGLNGFLVIRFVSGESKAEEHNRELAGNQVEIPAVSGLEILPLVDYEAENTGLKTEAGLAYLVRAGQHNVLFDVGYNKLKEETSPLLHNMERLGVSLEEIEAVVISHNHVDHVGGLNSINKEVKLTKGDISLQGKPVYTPVDMTCKTARTFTLNRPTIISGGIVSTGPLMSRLFISGSVPEQALLINIKNKGLVLISGCGHPQIVKMINTAKAMTGIDVKAVVGGFHLYYTEPNGGKLPIIFGSDRLFAGKPSQKEVERTVLTLKENGVEEVYLSPHDADEPTLRLFQKHFGSGYERIRVGKPISIGEV
jgi:7,8-dihydropterin-6-yl-methyl-4-(beta-D-ribofuranosyl)aminobenzene 5'-phosphate synthase